MEKYLIILGNQMTGKSRLMRFINERNIMAAFVFYDEISSLNKMKKKIEKNATRKFPNSLVFSTNSIDKDECESFIRDPKNELNIKDFLIITLK